MKYVVSGYIGFDNFGDELIAHSLVQKLKNEGAEDITLISSNPQKTSDLHEVKSCGMLKFFNSLKQADVLISGGGSLLQDVTSLKSLIYYIFVIYTALFLGKKVVIYAQGIGPVNSKLGRMLTKSVLKKVNSISVRDINSQNLLKNWGIESELVKDPALELDLPKKSNKGSVGIQLRDFKGITNEFLEKLSLELVKNFPDKKFKLLSLQDSIDLDICKRFKKTLSLLKISDVEIIHNSDLNEVISSISELEYLVSMRFHASVVGIKSGVKTLCINYDPKVQALAEEYNLPFINLNDKDFSSSFEKLR